MRYRYSGLTAAEVTSSRRIYGANNVTQKEMDTFWDKLLDNFKDPMILILLVALAIVTVLALTGYAHWYEGLGIAGAVALATIVSTISEYKNEKTFQKLQEEASRIAVNAFREGYLRSIPIEAVVKGDMVLLEPGDKVPADGHLVAGDVFVNQAMFTGEAEAVAKRPGGPDDDQRSMDNPHQLFRGTTIADGDGVMEITRVGDATHFGQLAGELGASDRVGPLRVKLARLAQGISRFGYIGASFIAAAFIFKAVFMDNGFAWARIADYFANWQGMLYDVSTAAILAVIIIVVAVPEGLPMMIAIVLSQNMRKLLSAKVLVRQLMGIDTAGSLNILFCDKTGTITRGELQAVGFAAVSGIGEDGPAGPVGGGEASEAGGGGSEAGGGGSEAGGGGSEAGGGGESDAADDGGLMVYPSFGAIPEPLRHLLRLSITRNTSCVFDPAAKNHTQCLVGGNMTEKALLGFILPTLAAEAAADGLGGMREPGRAAGAGQTGAGQTSAGQTSVGQTGAGQADAGEEEDVVERIRFSSERKFSATELTMADGRPLCLFKGAPEKLLARCVAHHAETGETRPLSPGRRERMEAYLNERSSWGFRIIAIATSRSSLKRCGGEPPADMALLGFVTIRDELRAEAPGAIKTLFSAGINVVMLTGDKMGTARAVAAEAGLLRAESDLTLESAEMDRLSDAELRAALPSLRVIARCLPSDKKRLVKVAQAAGYVVGMTGDGVNDAPALNSADVGFGMGSGSEVAKEASEIVILDNNVESIVNAVHYGRTIYRSIQKFITFQLTVNISAILVAFLGPFLGFRMPLTMIQLLWINLIMDTLAALAFSGEPALEKHMREAPKRRDEPIINRQMWSSILSNGLFVAVISVIFLVADPVERLFHSREAFLSAFFAFFVFINNFNKFNVRVEEMNLFAHILENRMFLKIVGLIFVVQVLITYLGGEMFRTVALRPEEWFWVTLLALSVVPFDLARKAIRRGSGIDGL